MRPVGVIVGYVLRESLRRRVFVVVLLLTAAFLLLYWLGVREAFQNLEGFDEPGFVDVDPKAIAGSNLLGLAMFGTLFLGAVLAVFLTLGAIRGDAERGMLQPLVVRPVGRGTLLVARFLGACAVAVPFVLTLYAATTLITGLVGDWWPDRVVTPALTLGVGVAVIAALSVLGSVLLSAVANGIAVFMIFGAGLVAGLLGQIGYALNSDTLETVARVAAWALPFEALYQSGLDALTADTTGFTGVVVRLGPFGGAQAAGDWLWPWTIAYLVAVMAVAHLAFARRDL